MEVKHFSRFSRLTSNTSHLGYYLGSHTSFYITMHVISTFYLLLMLCTWFTTPHKITLKVREQHVGCEPSLQRFGFINPPSWSPHYTVVCIPLSNAGLTHSSWQGVVTSLSISGSDRKLGWGVKPRLPVKQLSACTCLTFSLCVCVRVGVCMRVCVKVGRLGVYIEARGHVAHKVL